VPIAAFPNEVAVAIANFFGWGLKLRLSDAGGSHLAEVDDDAKALSFRQTRPTLLLSEL